MDTKDTKETANNSILMAVLCYLGPLVIISYLTSRSDEFVKFHIKQGLAIFGLEVIVWFLATTIWSLWMLYNIINLATLVLSIIGIVNAVQGRQKELPVIGKFAQGFSI